MSDFKTKRKILPLFSLILAGETIFFLPFVLARIFRPTLLEAFGISNTELGSYFSIYGIVAMLSYFFGGPLADKFSAKKLMAFALWLTGSGGFVMILIPTSFTMKVLYGFWGFTTIFLFWAALIRATREWGANDFQGRAYGWLEGGRGATAAGLGTLAFFLFSYSSGREMEGLLIRGGFSSFQLVILAVSIFTLLIGLLLWFTIPESSINKRSFSLFKDFKKIKILLTKPTIWMLSVIIVCAYSGYKITDDFSLYAREVLGFSEVNAAATGTGALWVRAFVAILAGNLADKTNRSKLIIVGFAFSIIGALLIGLDIFHNLSFLILFSLFLTMVGVYSVRALYFAVQQEAGISLNLSGTAIGIVSFIGFTPDIFMSPWMGALLDKNPGITGHQHVFLVLVCFSVVGFFTSIAFLRSGRAKR